MNFYEAVMERRSGEERRRIDRELDEAWERRHPEDRREVEDDLEVLTGSTRR